VETFSADLATVTVRGINIHPAMIQAVRWLVVLAKVWGQDRS
jgi:hypothetical protein